MTRIEAVAAEPRDALSPRVRVAAAVGALTVAAAAIRFSTLGVQSYWTDEGFTVEAVHRGLGHLGHQLAHSEANPPLYYVLAWGWAHLFGTGEVALRSLSALFGTALVPVAFLAGAVVAGRRTGFAAAALVAVNPLLVWYSQEARNYALLTLLGGLSVLAAAAVARRRAPDRRTLWAWGAVCALALATHYFAAFLIAPELVWLLLARPELRRRIWVSLVPLVVTGIVLLPLLQYQRHHAAQQFGFRDESLQSRAGKLVKQFLVGFDSPSERLVSGVAALCVLVGLVGLARGGAWRNVRALAAVAVASTAAPFALAVATAQLDYFKTQNLLASLLPFVLVVAAGMVATRAGVVALAVLSGLSFFLLVAVATNVQYQREDWRDPFRLVGHPVGAAALVITPESGPVLDHYRPGTTIFPSSGTRLVREVDFVGLATKAELGRYVPPPATARSTLPGFRRVAVVTTSKYTVVREVAPTPRPVTDAMLRAARLGAWAADRVMIQYAG